MWRREVEEPVSRVSERLGHLLLPSEVEDRKPQKLKAKMSPSHRALRRNMDRFTNILTLLQHRQVHSRPKTSSLQNKKLYCLSNHLWLFDIVTNSI